jgi:hypothetical protein
MPTKNGTVVFFDLAGYSKRSDPVQLQVANKFMKVVGDTLAGLWDQPCTRKMETSYFVLPTGDGAAVILWEGAPKLLCLELTALWLAAKVLRWAASNTPPVGVRCGINAGLLDEVTDPWGQGNWCGAAINEAARIMDSAQSGQILASQQNFVQRLNESEGRSHPRLRFVLSRYVHQILVKHNLTLDVRSIQVRLVGDGEDAWIGPEEGQDDPAAAWHLQMDPPILDVDTLGREIKTPPVELIAGADRLAFLGANNPRLAKSLREAHSFRGHKPWQSIEVFFLDQRTLMWLCHQGESGEALERGRQGALEELRSDLNSWASNWALYEHDRPFYFASYLDWDRPGGLIHVSPYIWGCDLRRCPAIDYSWRTNTPTKQYVAYRDGLDGLRSIARQLAP